MDCLRFWWIDGTTWNNQKVNYISHLFPIGAKIVLKLPLWNQWLNQLSPWPSRFQESCPLVSLPTGFRPVNSGWLCPRWLGHHSLCKGSKVQQTHCLCIRYGVVALRRQTSKRPIHQKARKASGDNVFGVDPIRVKKVDPFLIKHFKFTPKKIAKTDTLVGPKIGKLGPTKKCSNLQPTKIGKFVITCHNYTFCGLWQINGYKVL